MIAQRRLQACILACALALPPLLGHAQATAASFTEAVARAPAVPAPGSPAAERVADFGREPVHADAKAVANWIAASGDNKSADFVIIDKKHARVYVFDASARVRGSSFILLGATKGDETVPGVGNKPLTAVRQDEKTTPAGRFVGERGFNARGEDVVWVDYEAAVSMHRVINTNPQERRLQRLATNSLEDKRISYGCINIPVKFFETHVAPTFAKQPAVVYVLPEVKPLHEVFPQARASASGASPAAAAIKVSTH